MVRPHVITMLLAALVFSAALSRSEPASTEDTDSVTALIRCDDVGMCHGVNTAVREIAEAGFPFSASVMVACPWFEEAVAILKAFPHISPGIHLMLNSEWRDYRWGPIAGAGRVPSLVDSNGYFFPSRASFFANGPELEEVETELRAQISRALRSGVKFDYVDYHMGTAVDTPELRALIERLAPEYGLGISRYFGEKDVVGVYNAPIEGKGDTLVARVRSLSPDTTWLMVFHPGLETPEMDALVDLNSFGLTEVSKHRSAERYALLSDEFLTALKQRPVRLVTYRDLLNRFGVGGMRRPEKN